MNGKCLFPVSSGQVAHGLDSESVPPYPEGHLLFRLERENHEILATLGELQAQSILAQKSAGSPGSIRETLKKFTALKTHYVALQNELFPLFESASAKNACARLMWAIEDDVLLVQRELCESPLAEDAHYFWKDFGKFFLMAGALAYRERKILFPAAFRSIPSEYFSPKDQVSETSFITRTGTLSPVELEAILMTLPVDIAFIGADDRVKFYSDPPHRIFPRSPAVIGRLVQNCHPPKSAPTVYAHHRVAQIRRKRQRGILADHEWKFYPHTVFRRA